MLSQRELEVRISHFWMAAVGAVIFLANATAIGARGSAPIALALLAAAVWTAL
jgi:hypothetical protein